ncbi:MAG: stage III sporulation protein AF [Clostridia bacterium]|nr:stage III sporulation protein AF [Clostridia bacterium]MBQ4542569.1 stage III sporulation protein AF [Clostridia bacterium]
MGFIRTVIVLILIKPLINIILPDENIKKYINFVVGLMVIILLTAPISKIEFKNIFNFENNVTVPDYKAISDKNIKEIYRQQLEKDLSGKFNVKVEVEVDDNLKIIDIQSEKQQEIEEYLGI